MDTDNTIAQAAEVFEGMLSSDGAPDSGFMAEQTGEPEVEQPEELQAEEVSEEVESEEETLEASDEEEAEEVTEEPELDEVGQWLGDVQESLTDNPELLDQLQLTIKVDGEEKTLTLAEIRQSSMREADYTRKTQALAEQRKEFNKQQEEQQSKFNATMQEVMGVTNTIETQLQTEYNAVNWDELRAVDPAEWSAKKQEFQDRYNGIQQMKHNATTKAQQFHQEKMQTEKAQAVEVLLADIPEWKDEDVMARGLNSARDVALSYGMSEQFIGSVNDAGFIKAMRDLSELKAGKEVVKSNAKKLKAVPKFTKAGAKKSTGSGEKKRQVQSLNRLKKTGTVADAAAVFEQFL